MIRYFLFNQIILISYYLLLLLLLLLSLYVSLLLFCRKMADVDSLFDVFDDKSAEKSSSSLSVSSAKSSDGKKTGKSASDILKRHREDGIGSHTEESKRIKADVTDELK